MIEIDNVLKSKLEAGGLALGVGLRQARTVDIAKAMKTAGFDWLFIDMEHNAMDLDMATQISVAAQDAGITPIVRVPGFESFHATRALDCGAQGIVVPHVDDAETAARMVAHCRYPPDGHRSMGGALPQIDFAPHPVGEVAAAINKATFLIFMLETRQAIENVEAIAAVPGYDALLIGTNDLCMDLGMPGAFDHPDVAAIYERVIAACRANGKHAGMGGIYAPDLMQRFVGMGMRLILTGSDFSFMMSAAKAQAATVRALL